MTHGQASGTDPRAGRLFLGVPVTRAARGALEEKLRGEALPGRTVPPRNWHLTLAFLGDVSARDRERLIHAIRAAELGERTSLTFGGLGAFPRPARASTLWLGVREGGGALVRLHDQVKAAVLRAGLPAGDRPYTPHLTLSRIRPARDVRGLVERLSDSGVSMVVDALVLFRSHLGNGPARYEELERFALVTRE